MVADSLFPNLRRHDSIVVADDPVKLFVEGRTYCILNIGCTLKNGFSDEGDRMSNLKREVLEISFGHLHSLNGPLGCYFSNACLNQIIFIWFPWSSKRFARVARHLEPH